MQCLNQNGPQACVFVEKVGNEQIQITPVQGLKNVVFCGLALFVRELKVGIGPRVPPALKLWTDRRPSSPATGTGGTPREPQPSGFTAGQACIALRPRPGLWDFFPVEVRCRQGADCAEAIL